MASWTTFTDALLAVGKFLSSDTVKAIRDNFSAMAEGHADAPNIQAAALDTDIGLLIGSPNGSVMVGTGVKYAAGTVTNDQINVTRDEWVVIGEGYIYNNSASVVRAYLDITRNTDDNHPQMRTHVEKWVDGAWSDVHDNTNSLTSTASYFRSPASFDASVTLHRVRLSVKLASGGGTDDITVKTGSYLSWT